MSGVRSYRSIATELERVERLVQQLPYGKARDEQYGAMQALMWVLGRDVASPHTLAESLREARQP